MATMNMLRVEAVGSYGALGELGGLTGRRGSTVHPEGYPPQLSRRPHLWVIRERCEGPGVMRPEAADLEHQGGCVWGITWRRRIHIL